MSVPCRIYKNIVRNWKPEQNMQNTKRADQNDLFFNKLFPLYEVISNFSSR